ncbi:MAG: hypothetical protein HDQ95_10020 [Roseburia sp.]|nr:hypothetical protein [Roseburia sp.]
MKYYYRMLSDKRREELATLEVRDMYGIMETFIDPCAVSEDETIVFCDLAYAHDYNESGDEDEYFLAYGSLLIKVYLKHYVEKEINNNTTVFIHTYDIKHISVSPDKREELIKKEKEMKEILKEIIPVFEQGHMSRSDNQRIFKVINC